MLDICIVISIWNISGWCHSEIFQNKQCYQKWHTHPAKKALNAIEKALADVRTEFEVQTDAAAGDTSENLYTTLLTFPCRAGRPVRSYTALGSVPARVWRRRGLAGEETWQLNCSRSHWETGSLRGSPRRKGSARNRGVKHTAHIQCVYCT